MRLLPECPDIDRADAARVRADHERFAADGMPADAEGYIRDAYRIDVSSRYAGWPVKNPFGKASGQLALNANQVRADAEAGLGFVVLKTVIAQDAEGQQAMREWAIKETHMHLEPIAARTVGELGWTVTWKGRGWHDTFAAYSDFFRQSLDVARPHRMVVAPSCKYHLPGPGETEWKTSEYDFTTRELLNVWQEAGSPGPMPLEKDFSPTLAGDRRSREQERILEWLAQVPRLIRAAVPAGSVRLGLKLMNATFDDEFQFDLIAASLAERPDYLVYANRLFDPQKEFEGKVGVAYGGPDLSQRNLRLLTRLRREELAGALKHPVPPISGTGDVSSGQMAVEYALRGAENVQMHTLFQLPDRFFAGRRGNKTHRMLHYLYFHPRLGLVPWLLHLRQRHELVDADGATRFGSLATWWRGQEGPAVYR